MTTPVDMDVFAELMTLNLGVSQPDNARAFELLSRICPVRVTAFHSGAEHNGWIVPNEWHVRRATISRDGTVVFDGGRHPMAVAGYSSGFRGTVSKAELDRHVFSNPRIPDAYVFFSLGNYRPWQSHWGFCIPFGQYKDWPEGEYTIDLDVEFVAGEMLVGDVHKAGSTDETIVFNAHTCHPCQANDDLSGVMVIAALFQWLAARDTKYSYRGVFAPEHVGTVFYLSRMSDSDLERFKLGCFVEMVGSDTPLVLQQSFGGDSVIDRVAEYALRTVQPDVRVQPFRTVVGNDETVWEAPGIEVPMVSISRFPYAQYHTSADNLSIISMQRLLEALEAMKTIVNVLEGDAVVTRRFRGLVALSNPRFNLYVERPDPAFDKRLSDDELRLGNLQDRLPRYFDGRHSLFEIAQSAGVSFDRLRRYLERFVEKELVDLKPINSIDSYRTLVRPPLAGDAHSPAR